MGWIRLWREISTKPFLVLHFNPLNEDHLYQMLNTHIIIEPPVLNKQNHPFSILISHFCCNLYASFPKGCDSAIAQLGNCICIASVNASVASLTGTFESRELHTIPLYICPCSFFKFVCFTKHSSIILKVYQAIPNATQQVPFTSSTKHLFQR